MTYTIATSAGMIEANASNIIFLTPIWRITSRDGLVAAYSGHTRNSVGRLFYPLTPFTFGGVTYNPSVVTNTRDMHKIGLQPNSTQITGLFDDIIKRNEVEGGRWKIAEVVYEYVSYLDPSLGSTGKIAGTVGQIHSQDPFYQMDVVSKAGLLQQQIGEMTSPTDRNNFPAGLDKDDWSFTRNILSTADRRHVVIDGVAQADSYFKNGTIVWSTGFNSIYQGMEIKYNVGNTIELQLPMPNTIHGEFIKSVFKAVLNRAPTAGEQTTWATNLHAAFLISTAAVVTAATPLVGNIFASAEYAARRRTDRNFIIDVYAAYLNRFPDTSGFTFWLAQVAATSRAAVCAGFAASTEFHDRFLTADPSLPGSCDSVILLAGYDGSRGQLRDKFNDAINGNMEPDLPGMRQVFSYPE